LLKILIKKIFFPLFCFFCVNSFYIKSFSRTYIFAKSNNIFDEEEINFISDKYKINRYNAIRYIILFKSLVYKIGYLNNVDFPFENFEEEEFFFFHEFVKQLPKNENYDKKLAELKLLNKKQKFYNIWEIFIPLDNKQLLDEILLLLRQKKIAQAFKLGKKSLKLSGLNSGFVNDIPEIIFKKNISSEISGPNSFFVKEEKYFGTQGWCVYFIISIESEEQDLFLSFYSLEFQNYHMPLKVSFIENL